MAKFRFDDKAIRDLPPATARSRIRVDYDIPAASGKGEFVRGLALRTSSAGAKSFLLCYVTKAGVERRHKIGDYPTHTVATAREAARRLRALVDSGRDPYDEEATGRAQADAKRVLGEATLGRLLDAYVQHLRNSGKASASEVEAAVARNLARPFPRLLRAPADAITTTDVLPALHRLTKAGKWRAAEKLAVYLRAAYNAAKAARSDAAGYSFHGFDVRSNPLIELQVTRPRRSAASAAEFGSERKWALSKSQFQSYWQRIQRVPDPHGALLRFHLLTGGQRMEQLSRLHERDYNSAARTITLWDSKGRRSEPRTHALPLLPGAEDALRQMRLQPEGPHLFTVSKGRSPAVPHTLASALRSVSKAMESEGEVDRPITPGTIRRTVETLLAESGVSKDIRAQLLSHGISGVQDRHYDAGDYLRQKHEALAVLESLIEPFQAKVAPLSRTSRRAGRS